MPFPVWVAGARGEVSHEVAGPFRRHSFRLVAEPSALRSGGEHIESKVAGCPEEWAFKDIHSECGPDRGHPKEEAIHVADPIGGPLMPSPVGVAPDRIA